ncbi:nad-dependent epimerase dehydratase [Qipengyuania citrea LAMA 915]|uniref:Nad-dependent epimerase dehydratase n=1 Tax=Qipengyuania citrea LAMA 915 TaxID=1306953 RepID=A0A0L1KH38_9SPHN|nr:NAD(P)H-binding protein [Qipengyuania citrea]KNH03184.1 nad-dependent epimerase dehydratase [Qipengyuania citrea LAMA 915]
MTVNPTLAVFEAGGKTGTLLLEQATRRGHHVRGLEHHLPDPANRIEGVDYLRCDVLEDDLADAIRGCDAVISTLGVSFTPSTAIDPPPLYTKGTRRILEAMGRAGVDRIAVISATFVDQQPAAPLWFRLTAVPALTNILEHMRAMERMLEAERGLSWTAARPGWLIDLPYSGEAQVKARTLRTDCFRCRHADLAALLLDSVVSGTWINEKPAIGKPETDDLEGVLALREELENLFGAASR